jgi:S-adenosylmethionine/arginine decarboxylase-like enzyme
MSELEAHHWIFGAELREVPSQEVLERALDALLVAVAMEPVTRLVSVRGEDWDAVQIIAESHIILHGKGMVACADVFSCKPFDVNAVRRVLSRELGSLWHEERVARGAGRD